MSRPAALNNDTRRTMTRLYTSFKTGLTPDGQGIASMSSAATTAGPGRAGLPADRGRGQRDGGWAAPSRWITSASTSPSRRDLRLLGTVGLRQRPTLLRMLAASRRPPRAGSCSDGQDIAGLPPYERPFNMMFQSTRCSRTSRCGENVAFGLRRDGMPKDQIAERVEAMQARPADRSASASRTSSPAASSSAWRWRGRLAKRPQMLPRRAARRARQEAARGDADRARQHHRGRRRHLRDGHHDQEEAMTMATRIAMMSEGGCCRSAPVGCLRDAGDAFRR